MAKTVRCRIGWHSWRKANTEDGQVFRECARCGTVQNPGGLSSPPPFG